MREGPDTYLISAVATGEVLASLSAFASSVHDPNAVTRTNIYMNGATAAALRDATGAGTPSAHAAVWGPLARR